MAIGLYDLHILTTFDKDIDTKRAGGFCNGINNNGRLIVGEVYALGPDGSFPGEPLGAFWHPAPTYGKLNEISRWLLKVADDSWAVTFDQFIINLDSLDSTKGVGLTTFPTFATGWDINNAQQALGFNEGYASLVVFNIATNAQAVLEPLPGEKTVGPGGINDMGDVVGTSGEFGVFYPAGSSAVKVGKCSLNDINNERGAVGEEAGVGPIYVDLSKTKPSLEPIPLPKAAESSSAFAINSGGTVIGSAESKSFEYPFVYQAGQYGAAIDLNDAIVSNSGYQVISVSDINDAGQIVGYAFHSSGRTLHPCLLTPRSPITLPLPGNWTSIWGGIAVDGGGWTTPGGPVGPGPGWIAAIMSLPLDQREVILSFSISNFASLMSDREARTQVQEIAASAAFRALESRREHQEAPAGFSQREAISRAIRARRRRLRHGAPH